MIQLVLLDLLGVSSPSGASRGASAHARAVRIKQLAIAALQRAVTTSKDPGRTSRLQASLACRVVSLARFITSHHTQCLQSKLKRLDAASQDGDRKAVHDAVRDLRMRSVHAPKAVLPVQPSRSSPSHAPLLTSHQDIADAFASHLQETRKLPSNPPPPAPPVLTPTVMENEALMTRLSQNFHRDDDSLLHARVSHCPGSPAHLLYLRHLRRLNRRISSDDTRDAAAACRATSAPGSDGIPFLVLQILGTETLRCLTLLYNACLSGGVSPPQFLESVVHPLFKGNPLLDPDTHLLANYRGISLAIVMGKCLEKILLLRTEEFDSTVVGAKLHANQDGYLRGRGGCGHVHTLCNAIRELGANSPVLVTDVVTAFGAMIISSGVRGLFDRGYAGNFLRLVISLLLNNSSVVLVGGARSFPYDALKGSAEGKILSGYVYINFLDPVLWRVHQSGCGFYFAREPRDAYLSPIGFGETRDDGFAGALALADDLLSIPRGCEDLQDIWLRHP